MAPTDTDCPMCWGPLGEPVHWVSTEFWCRVPHQFHKECIHDWLEMKGPQDIRCPFCLSRLALPWVMDRIPDLSEAFELIGKWYAVKEHFPRDISVAQTVARLRWPPEPGDMVPAVPEKYSDSIVVSRLEKRYPEAAESWRAMLRKSISQTRFIYYEVGSDKSLTLAMYGGDISAAIRAHLRTSRVAIASTAAQSSPMSIVRLPLAVNVPPIIINAANHQPPLPGANLEGYHSDLTTSSPGSFDPIMDED